MARRLSLMDTQLDYYLPLMLKRLNQQRGKTTPVPAVHWWRRPIAVRAVGLVAGASAVAILVINLLARKALRTMFCAIYGWLPVATALAFFRH